MCFVVQNDEEHYCSLWLKRLGVIFTSAGGCKPYSLPLSNIVSLFSLQNSKSSTDFGARIDLQQFQTNSLNGFLTQANMLFY